MSDFKPRKFRALVDEFGFDDGGVASFIFRVQSLKKDKIYKESNPKYLTPPRNQNVVIDDNSCWHHITNKNFFQKFEEVYD
jgi:hypothetical protein